MWAMNVHAVLCVMAGVVFWERGIWQDVEESGGSPGVGGAAIRAPIDTGDSWLSLGPWKPPPLHKTTRIEFSAERKECMIHAVKSRWFLRETPRPSKMHEFAIAGQRLPGQLGSSGST
jgi:hypothetical protein